MPDSPDETSTGSTPDAEEAGRDGGGRQGVVRSRRAIVPPAFRSAFLGERWVAGRPCVVQAALCSTALLVDITFTESCWEFAARYEYQAAEDALLALRDWDGRFDPPGAWIRVPASTELGATEVGGLGEAQQD